MDLYRYFHPHYHPQLLKKPLRLQELCELRQAAKELKKAMTRALLRSKDLPQRAEYLKQSAEALDYVIEVLSSLAEAHEGDSDETLFELLNERRKAPGWDHWSRLLEERLQTVRSYKEPPKHSSSS